MPLGTDTERRHLGIPKAAVLADIKTYARKLGLWSGEQGQDRCTQLHRAIALGAGDVLMVSGLDCLARSTAACREITSQVPDDKLSLSDPSQ